MRRPVVQAENRETADRLVVVVARKLVQERADVVDQARVVAGEKLERDERGAAAGRALVLDSPAQELRLLAVPELTDRAIGDSPLAIVGRPSEALDLVLPLRPEPGEGLFLSGVGQGGRLGSR